MLDDLRALALQLSLKSVLPLIGAGGSVDCGMRLARELGKDLLEDYQRDARFAPHVKDLEANLGVVAEEIYLKAGQRTVVEVLGFPDPALWPPASAITEHFCAYRVLARLSREQLFREAITLNYDCGYEAGLHGEGFALEPDVRPGRVFPDHATVIADERTASNVDKKGPVVLRKLHGCAAHYRAEVARDPTSEPEEAIVVRRGQLQGWGDRTWARRRLCTAAEENVILLIGCSAQDPMIVGELKELLAKVYKVQAKTGDPRVVVIDHNPGTQELRTLVHDGLGCAELGPDKVACVSTASGTTTAALLVLLAELLAHGLASALAAAGYDLPGEIDARLAALVLAAPVMLRWSYLLRPREDGHLLQLCNLHDAAKRGYVPLLIDPTATARALLQRSDLRAAVGLPAVESAPEVLAGHGFVIDAGEVGPTCRPASPPTSSRVPADLADRCMTRESCCHPRSLSASSLRTTTAASH